MSSTKSTVVIVTLACALLLNANTALHADEVVLTTGITKVGIIESETDQMVRLRTDVGTTGISRAFIVEVRRDSPENNAALEVQWATAFEAERERRAMEAEAAAAFAEEQRAKGRVLYEGDWLTQAEANLRIQARKQELAAENDRRVAAANAERDQALQQVEQLKQKQAELHQELVLASDEIGALERRLHESERDLVRTREYWADALSRLRRCQRHVVDTPLSSGS